MTDKTSYVVVIKSHHSHARKRLVFYHTPGRPYDVMQACRDEMIALGLGNDWYVVKKPWQLIQGGLK